MHCIDFVVSNHLARLNPILFLQSIASSHSDLPPSQSITDGTEFSPNICFLFPLSILLILYVYHNIEEIICHYSRLHHNLNICYVTSSGQCKLNDKTYALLLFKNAKHITHSARACKLMSKVLCKMYNPYYISKTNRYCTCMHKH